MDHVFTLLLPIAVFTIVCEQFAYRYTRIHVRHVAEGTLYSQMFRSLISYFVIYKDSGFFLSKGALEFT